MAKMPNKKIMSKQKDTMTGEIYQIEPLFTDMMTPKQEQVGFLLPLTCGHNRHPNPNESYLFTKHLQIAGFLDPPEEAEVSLDEIEIELDIPEGSESERKLNKDKNDKNHKSYPPQKISKTISLESDLRK